MEIKIRTHEEFRTDRVTIEITGTNAEVRDLVDSESSTKLPSRNLYTDGEVAALQASEAELVAGPLRRRIAELERTLASAIDRESKLDEELTRRAGIVKRLENKVDGYDTDRHTERDRADRIAREHQECAGKLELREKDADTFRRRAIALETRAKELEARLTTSEEDLTAERQRADRAERLLAREVKRAEELEIKLMEGHVCTGGCSGDQHVAFVGRKALTEAENQVAALTRRIDNARVLLSDPEVTQTRGMFTSRLGVKVADAIGKALDTLA